MLNNASGSNDSSCSATCTSASGCSACVFDASSGQCYMLVPISVQNCTNAPSMVPTAIPTTWPTTPTSQPSQLPTTALTGPTLAPLTAIPTFVPSPAPTFMPPYQPVPVPPGSLGERCVENGTLTPLINPTVDECYQYCSLYVDGGLTTPFYFNFYSLGSTLGCYCVGQNCTLITVPNWAPYQVNNKTIPTGGPSATPTSL